MNRLPVLFLALFTGALSAQTAVPPKRGAAPAGAPAQTAPAPTAPAAVTPRAQAAPDSMATMAADTLSAQDESIKIKKTAVAFLGLESIAENTFHETLEKRIYIRLSYNKNVSLEPRDFFFKAKSRGFVEKKLLSMNEAVDLMKISGDRVFVSGEIREWKITQRRALGFMPFGKVVGEIVCYLQVLDALEKEPRFAGNIKFIGEMDAGWLGFTSPDNSLPISPEEEKHFKSELITGLGDAVAETAEASYVGIIEKKSQTVVKKSVIQRGAKTR